MYRHNFIRRLDVGIWFSLACSPFPLKLKPSPGSPARVPPTRKPRQELPRPSFASPGSAWQNRRTIKNSLTPNSAMNPGTPPAMAVDLRLRL